MKDEEIISALQRGGDDRLSAITIIFKHEGIRRGIAKVLKPYMDKLDKQFPKVQSRFLEKGEHYTSSAVDYFFQDAIFILERKIREGTFRGQSFGELNKFLSSTAKFLCLGWLRKQKNTDSIDPSGDAHTNPGKEGEEDGITGNSPTLEAPQDVEDDYLQKARKEMLLKLLRKMRKKCRKIILLDAYGYKNEEIAELMNFTNESVRTSKSQCRKQLHEMIRKNDNLLDLFGDFLKK